MYSYICLFISARSTSLLAVFAFDVIFNIRHSAPRGHAVRRESEREREKGSTASVGAVGQLRPTCDSVCMDNRARRTAFLGHRRIRGRDRGRIDCPALDRCVISHQVSKRRVGVLTTRSQSRLILLGQQGIQPPRNHCCQRIAWKTRLSF